MNICVRLFGRFCVQQEGGVSLEIESHKALELFCYLLIHRNRPHTREALAEFIWGESSSPRAKKYLRQALWQLQSVLADYVPPDSEPLIIADTTWVQFNPAADVWVDVAEVEEAFISVQGRRGRELDEQTYLDLKRAIELYRGDLLEGWYEDWCLFERERLQNMYLSNLDKLMGYCEAHHAFEEALSFGEKILSFDNAREKTHRRMVRLYYLAGERTAAIRQYERCVTTLQEELGVKPANKTVELYEQICQDYSTDIEQTPLNLSPVDPSPVAPSPEIIEHLSHLEKLIEEFHHQVSEEIRSLQKSLKG